MVRCAELGLNTEDLDQMTVGMVYDMLVEKGNDREEYDIKAEPGSMRAFFGGNK